MTIGGDTGPVDRPPRGDIGPYRVIRLLGRGGFGSVFLAEQTVPVRREVAVKVLNPGMDLAELRARFEFERETLNLMKHPGISMLLDAGVTEDDQPYFVMEYVQGTPIREYLERNRLGLRERLKLFRGICDAVQHAHSKGVIHRDLTANNVLVVDLDGRPSPKIIDFGIAKAIGGAIDLTMNTTEGQAIGTPAYMSPEQARGDISMIDTRTDIYALGVQLYMLLTGTLPFTEVQLREAGVRILKMICEDDPEPPSRRVADVGGTAITSTWTGALRGDLDWITCKAMAKDRDERYASAAELGEDVRRFLENEPVLAGPPTTWYRIRKGLRRHRGKVAAAAAVLVTLIAGLVVSVNLYLRSERNAKTAEANLGRFNNLSDVLLLSTLRDDAGALGPARPENAPAMRAWLAKAEGLVGRLDLLRSVLAEGRSSAAPVTEEEGRARAFLLGELAGLVEELQDFAASPESELANVRARLAWAEEVRARTVDAHLAGWAAAARRVAADLRFAGFELAPKVGLVPLGPDPRSGLEEFVELRSGTIPPRSGPQGELAIDAATGIVLVLTPGGPFRLGATATDESDPRHDPAARQYEAAWNADGTCELVEVELAPFLIGKFEVTQSQWKRMTGGEEPSATSLAGYGKFGVVPTCPVENVSWARSRAVLGEYGMELPTEAQWEYACRAGTDTPWHCGDTERDLQGYANLADVTAREVPELTWENFDGDPIDDGWVFTSPVGTFLPNPFGLHDVHGNVNERCLDMYDYYDVRVLTGPTGLGVIPEASAEQGHVIRGGAYRYRGVFARSSFRWHTGPGTSTPDVGLRAAMALGD